MDDGCSEIAFLSFVLSGILRIIFYFINSFEIATFDSEGFNNILSYDLTIMLYMLKNN